jgi:hypothetical protein
MTNFIAATDFYQYALNKDWPIHEFYFTEDGRMNINMKKSTTAIVCKYINNIFKCVIYHEPDKKFIQRNYKHFDYELSFISETGADEELIEQLKLNFDWVK